MPNAARILLRALREKRKRLDIAVEAVKALQCGQAISVFPRRSVRRANRRARK